VSQNIPIFLVNSGYDEATAAIAGAEGTAKNEYSFLEGYPKLLIFPDSMDIDGIAHILKLSLSMPSIKLNAKAKED